MTTSARLKVVAPAVLSLLLPALLLQGCSGGGAGDQAAGGAFVVLKTEPANNGRIFLNQSIKIFFSNPVDIDTANFNSVAFFVRDANGESVSEQVVGTFRIGRDETGDRDPRILEFVPRLPSNDTFTNGGFRPARRYLVSLVTSNNPSAPTLRDADQRPLSDKSVIQSLSFVTASGTTPQELFLDTRVGGPRLTKSPEIAPIIGTRVGLNRFGEVPVVVELTFNQALNPSSSNVPIGQDLDPRNFSGRDRGRIYLEYDDPELGRRQWIPTFVEMPKNGDLGRDPQTGQELGSGAVIRMHPDGVLPNNAEVRVIVEAELQDIAGESNVKDASYNPVVWTFDTEQVFDVQFDGVILDFETAELMDAEAAFRDPVAELDGGVLRASFDFEGQATPFNYAPDTREVVLSTDFTTVVPTNGPPIAVAGGVFSFNNITIKEGKTVRGVGTNPMIWLATGEVLVDGHLHVDGGDGGQVDTLNSANFPTAGGQGVCTGGNGGKGSVDTTQSTQQGENGFGPNQRPNFGGQGGNLSCQGTSSAHWGAGGGGGSQATKGDPEYNQVFGGTPDPKASGKGGQGAGASGSFDGGLAGPLVFSDEETENDFWGRNIDANGTVINGELKEPVGGGGGGGGGDRTPGSTNNPCNTPSWINDEKGGGGGGGAGVLVVKALGRITIGQKGRISADGGRGGGGEDAGSCRQGGGGGGGAGGMVVLMSATGIDLVKHQGRWQQGDYNFSVTADGNIGRNTGFGRPLRLLKYPKQVGSSNAGGFGGMGVVQLLAPPGQDNDGPGGNGTGTVQDDNIRILESDGKTEDKNKVPFLVGGDIRPNPIYLPPPFSRFSQGRTRWIATGATERRIVSASLNASQRGPRSTISIPRHEEDAKTYGPDYLFAGTQTSGKTAGYLKTDPSTGVFTPPVVTLENNATRVKITSMVEYVPTSNSPNWRGRGAHTIDVALDVLPEDGSLANHRARLFAGSNVLRDYRILGYKDVPDRTPTHTRLFLDAVEDGNVDAGTLPRDTTGTKFIATDLEVLAKFFEVITNDNEGLGDTYEVKQGTQTFRYPIANAQIGFAFHRDPSRPDIQGNLDKNRFPQELDTFLFDLEDDSATGVREKLRKLHYGFLQVMVRFNLNYDHADPDLQPGPNPVGPASSKPMLRTLLVPVIY